MDSLTLDAIELTTCIGVPEDERSTPQRIIVSAQLFLDLARVGRSDDVRHSVDYADVARDIQTLARAPHRTIEAFAEDVAALVLKRRGVESVKVLVQKFPPIGVRSVWVTITRP